MPVNGNTPSDVSLLDTFKRFVDKANELIFLVDEIKKKYNVTEGYIGDVASLSTNDKSSLVSALNELHGEVNSFLQHVNDIGNTNSLPYNTDIVGNIQEIYDAIGLPLANLGDGSASSLVSWLNNLSGIIGDLASLSTNDTSSIVNAINSVISTIGNLSDLTTSNKNSIVDAVNEINSKVGQASEGNAGSIEIATQSEVDFGVDDTRAITPKKLSSISFSSNTGKNIAKIASFGSNPVGSGDILPNVFNIEEGSSFIQRVSGGYKLYMKYSGQWLQLTDVSTKQTYVVTGVPSNSLGNEEDFAIRQDFPYGIYYKKNGQWFEVRLYNFYEPLNINSSDEIVRKDGIRFIHTTYANGTLGRNIFIGEYAGNYSVGQGWTETWHGSNNSAIGYTSQSSITTGSGNNAIGRASQYSLTTGSNNNTIGHASQYSLTTGSNNSAIGYASQYSLTTGSGNNTIGYASQYSLTTGFGNNAIGHASQYSLTTGSGNNAIGYTSHRSLTTGSNNNAIGHASQYSLTTGSNNNAIGYASQYDLIDGNLNTTIGHNTGRGIVRGSNNTFVGAHINLGDVSNNIALATGDGNVRLRFDGANWRTNYHIMITNNSPELRFIESDTGSTGRIVQGSGSLYIQTTNTDGSSNAGGRIYFSGFLGEDLNSVEIKYNGAYRQFWHDSNFANRISILPTNSSPTGNESVACDDGKKVTLQAIAELAGPDFISGEIQVVSGRYAYKAAHGLGVVPSRIDAYLICKVADIGFQPGDIVRCYDTSHYDAHFWADASEVGWLTFYTPLLFIIDPTTKVPTSVEKYITPTSWTIKLLAWK